MWTSLSETSNRPFHAEYDLASRSLTRQASVDSNLETIEMAALAEAGRNYSRIRTVLTNQLVDAIPDDPTTVSRSLILLKLGKPPEDVAAYIEGIQEDLLAKDWSPWMAEISKAGVDRDQLVQALTVVTANPRQRPRFPRP